MALRDVNLVPGAVLHRRILVRHGIGWGILYAVAVLVVLAAYITTMQTIASRRRSPATEEEIRRRIALTITEIELKKEEVERLTFVRDVAGAFRIADVLQRLSGRLDPKVWFSNLSIQSGPEGSCELLMQGQAFSNARLGATIRALTDDPLIDDVALRSANEIRRPPQGIDGMPGQIVDFSIQAKLVNE